MAGPMSRILQPGSISSTPATRVSAPATGSRAITESTGSTSFPPPFASTSRAVSSAWRKPPGLNSVTVDWLPEVTPWSGVKPVSPKMTFTRSRGTKSSSATNWVCTVEKPFPNSIFPE